MNLHYRIVTALSWHAMGCQEAACDECDQVNAVASRVLGEVIEWLTDDPTTDGPNLPEHLEDTVRAVADAIRSAIPTAANNTNPKGTAA